MDRDIQHAVDTLLLEQGAYSPLELLLAEGRLRYADYEQWRCGDLEVLETRLYGDPEQCRRLLRQASEYCAVLGLQAETQAYAIWGGGGNRVLRFSLDPATQRAFSTHYSKSVDQPQLDLFMDSTGTTLANGIRVALCERDNGEARRLLDRLLYEDPGNNCVGGLERLVEAAEGLDVLPPEPAKALETLERELLPLAEELLGPGQRHFLVPLWKRLCRAFQGHAFDPEAPSRHVSYAAAKAGDWELARDSVESEPDWMRFPALLYRHARVSDRLHRHDLAMSDRFCICWQFPDQAVGLFAEEDPEWLGRVRRFRELEPELPMREFPSWLIVAFPGLARSAPEHAPFGAANIPPSYPVVCELYGAASGGGVDEGVVALRRRLKECSPVLFEHYMALRERS